MPALTKASRQIAPPACQPLTQHLAQQPPKAKRVLSPHWFHEHSTLSPSCWERRAILSRLPDLTEAHKTEEACTAPSSFLSMTVSVVFLSLFYDIQTMQAWEMTTIILDSEPPPSCATSGKFSSLFSSHMSQRVLWW